MNKFKIGDLVKITRGDSGDSIRFNGRIGKIIAVKSASRLDLQEEVNYYLLDIEIETYGNEATGIWEYELELIIEGAKEVKQFGIAEFCKKYY